jgi:hypothetical protein
MRAPAATAPLQQAFDVILRSDQHVREAAGEPVSANPGSAERLHDRQAGTQREQIVRETARVEHLEGACVHSERAAEVRLGGPSLEDRGVYASGREVSGKEETGRARTDDHDIGVPLVHLGAVFRATERGVHVSLLDRPGQQTLANICWQSTSRGLARSTCVGLHLLA